MFTRYQSTITPNYEINNVRGIDSGFWTNFIILVNHTSILLLQIIMTPKPNNGLVVDDRVLMNGAETMCEYVIYERA